MKYMTYTELRDAVLASYRRAADSSGHKVFHPNMQPERPHKVNPLNVRPSHRNEEFTGMSVVKYIAEDIFENWDACLTASGDIVLYPSIQHCDKDCAYRPATIIVTGQVNPQTNENMTGYTVQMRPATFSKRVSEVAPFRFLRKIKIGGNDFKVLNLSGSKELWSSYGVNTRETASTLMNGESFVWYDDRSGEPCPATEQSSAFDFDFRNGHYYIGASDCRQSNDFAFGASRSKTEWYESIRDVFRSIKGSDEYGVDLKQVLLLAAKAHTYAIQFASMNKNARIILMPMAPERYVDADYRGMRPGRGLGEADRYSLAWHLSGYSYTPSRIKSAASRVHYIGSPTAGEGCLMPSIIVTWQSDVGRKKLSKDQQQDAINARLGTGNHKWTDSVVITIPPVGHKALALDIRGTSSILAVRGSGADYRAINARKSYTGSSTGNTYWFRQGSEHECSDVCPEEFLAYPRSTFTAVKESGNDDIGYTDYYTENEQESTSLSIPLPKALQAMQHLFDFSQNQDCVAVEYHRTEIGTNKRWERKAVEPEGVKVSDIFAGLEQEALVDSLPLC